MLKVLLFSPFSFLTRDIVSQPPSPWMSREQKSGKELTSSFLKSYDGGRVVACCWVHFFLLFQYSFSRDLEKVTKRGQRGLLDICDAPRTKKVTHEIFSVDREERNFGPKTQPVDIWLAEKKRGKKHFCIFDAPPAMTA